MIGTSVKQVFISYAIEDTDFAHRLADDLKRLGVAVWIAPESIRPGEEWVNAIERGLCESSHIVIVLTPAALEASGANMERDMAITLALEDRIEMISLRLKPCEAPLVLSRYQMILAFEKDYDTGLNHLAGYLGLRVEPSEVEEEKKGPEPTWGRLPGLPILALVALLVIGSVFIVVFVLGDGALEPPGPTSTSTPATQTAEADRPARVVREASASPINTPIPSDTPTPPVPTAPCVGGEPEDPRFEQYWTDEFKVKLDCPELPTISSGGFAEQEFERGYMVWVGKGDLHFALYHEKDDEKTGKWIQVKVKEKYPNDWNQHGPSPLCDEVRDKKLYDDYYDVNKGPKSGFSMLWCAKELYGATGRPQNEEGEASGNLLLEFQNGYMLRDSRNRDYILTRTDGESGIDEGGTYIQK
jgi:hypothetical protein